MQGPEFIYFLMDEQFRTYSVENGIVTSSMQAKPLQFTPDGWQDMSIQNHRNHKYFAMDRSFTIPLAFVEDGAQILKNIYYNQGIEAKLFLVICKQELFIDATEFYFYYKLFYKGEVDFLTFKHEGYKVTVNIMEGGLPKLVKANEGVKYELPLNVPEAIKIKFDGIILKQRLSYRVVQDEYTGLALQSHFVPVVFLNKEGASVGIATGSQSLSDSDAFMMDNENTFDQAIKIDGSVKFQIKYAALNYRLIFFIRKEDNSTVTVFDSGVMPTSNNVDYTIPFTINTTLFSKSELYMRATYQIDASPQNGNGRKIVYYQTDISITFDFRYPVTYVKALRPRYVFEQLTAKNTDNAYQAQSNLLDQYKTIVLTSGNGLRSILDADIKTSLSEFFNSFNAVLCIGMGERNGKLTIEKKRDWIDYSTSINLGEVKNHKVSHSLDHTFKTIKTGYKEQEYDDVNGKNEFNNSHLYTTVITRNATELNLISDYRADCYGAEFIRINLDGKSTTDNRGDNAVWMIHIKPDPIIDPIEGVVYELDRSLNSFATGLAEIATLFNMFLSPKQNFYRSGPFIHSCFYKQDPTYIKFQTTEKASGLSVSSPVLVDEDADVEVAALDPALFLPVVHEFETQVPFNLMDLLGTNPLQTFLWTVDGLQYKGIPVKIGMQPEGNEAQVYQMYSAPDNNLTKLEEVFD